MNTPVESLHLDVPLQPSRRHRLTNWAIVAALSLAVVCLPLIAPAKVFTGILITLYGIGLWLHSQRVGQVQRLSFVAQELRVQTSRAVYVDKDYQFVLRQPWLIVLRWSAQNRERHTLLLPDAMIREDWRRLMLWQRPEN